jgi:hypothetical protein
MSIRNAINYGTQGLAIDAYTYGMTGGLPTKLALLYGLFKPDASDMDRVYQPERFKSEPTRTYYTGFNMFDQLFGQKSSDSHSGEWPTWLKFGAIAAGATLLLPMITRSAYFGGGLIPPFPMSIRSTPLSPAQLIPLAWRNGYIPNWGLMAGLIR